MISEERKAELKAIWESKPDGSPIKVSAEDTAYLRSLSVQDYTDRLAAESIESLSLEERRAEWPGKLMFHETVELAKEADAWMAKESGKSERQHDTLMVITALQAIRCSLARPIPVTERLPPRDWLGADQSEPATWSSCSNWVLAWNGHDWFMCYEQEGVWEEAGSADNITNVTHWLPLPPKPE